jgi:hypothetical protein
MIYDIKLVTVTKYKQSDRFVANGYYRLQKMQQLAANSFF